MTRLTVWVPGACTGATPRKRTRRLFVALILLCSTGVSAWESLVDTPTLRVDRRNYPGSQLDEIRGVTRVEASLNALMALLRDAPSNRHWVYRSGGANIVRQVGYAQAYVYGIVNAPLPMRDRDTVVRFDYRQQPDTKDITITITNVPDFLPESEDFVRVPDFGGFWHLQPEPDGRVKVTYQVHGDPGGWVPTWLANYAAAISVTRTLENLPRVVGRYEGARSEFVQEP